MLGDRLKEFLDIIVDAAEAEIPDSPEQIPEPSRVGRMQFRLLAGSMRERIRMRAPTARLRGECVCSGRPCG